MKKPLDPGTPVDQARKTAWLTRFAGYRHAITNEKIDAWLAQFDPTDSDVAARVLDCVRFLRDEDILLAYRMTLERLEGWSKNGRKRRGKWRFVPFSASSGESADSMVHMFRIANRLNYDQYNEMFIYKRDLLSEALGPNDSVVFIDDFAGTGNQACSRSQNINELLPGNPRIFLVLVAASVTAKTRICADTKLRVEPYVNLNLTDNIFSTQCYHFTPSEKNKILKSIPFK